MSDILRTAIIGCGSNGPGKGGAHSFSYAHGWSYAACPDTQLVTAVSRTKKNIDDFAAAFPGTHGYQDYHEMLCAEKPDLVSICAFPPDREAMVMAALAAGARGVWVEKPFALSLGAARRMMRAAEVAGARLFVNHQRRYGKPFEWLREAVVEEKIGKLNSFTITLPMCSVLDIGPHLIDAALFCLGSRQAVKVVATADLSKISERQGMCEPAHLLASVHFDDGTRLVFETGACAGRLPVLRADGTDGFAELHLTAPAGAVGIFRARYAGVAELVNPVSDENFDHNGDPALFVKRALASIVQALRTGAATRIDAPEAWRGLEIIFACYESARRRQVVMLPLPEEEFDMASTMGQEVLSSLHYA